MTQFNGGTEFQYNTYGGRVLIKTNIQKAEECTNGGHEYMTTIGLYYIATGWNSFPL